MFLSQIPPNLSPLTPDQSQKLHNLMADLTPVQQAWISGFLAAKAEGGQMAGAVAGSAAPGKDATLTILYGSQTGNAHGIAEDLAAKAKEQGLKVKLTDMADYKPNSLKNEDFLAIVVSTYGEGEPPEPAEKLHAFLSSKKAPKLDGVKIAVLGLGDSSYEFFCQTAVDFEERLTKLGAEVLVEKALLDVDYDDEASSWIAAAVEGFKPEIEALAGSSGMQADPFAGQSFGAASSASPYNKKNPFEAEVGAVQKITGRDSTKDVRHIEILLEGSGLTYQAGDALGVYFLNDEKQIDESLSALGLDGEQEVTIGDETLPVRKALIEIFELTQSYPGFVEKYGAATGNETLISLLEDKAALRDYIADRQIFDIIRDHPANLSAQDLVGALRKMQPRLYSIASSQSEVDEEVHLTVGVVEYDAFGETHLGGCSGFIGRRVEEGDKLRVYVEKNDKFRLPQNPDTPVVMVGPGTGIAPFRAFLQEREAQEATGKNWLFFGNPHFTQDFLYQVEMQRYLKSGLLTKMNVAFSRDQAEKIYVQDRLIENGKALYDWLESGAHFYVCGDANRMAKDVHQALLDVIVEHGGKSQEAATDYLEALRDQGRYQKDVY